VHVTRGRGRTRPVEHEDAHAYVEPSSCRSSTGRPRTRARFPYVELVHGHGLPRERAYLCPSRTMWHPVPLGKGRNQRAAEFVPSERTLSTPPCPRFR